MKTQPLRNKPSESVGSRLKSGRKRDDSLDHALLEAAHEVLLEQGAAGFTMDAVAAHAGTGKATIYRRWASKELLMVDAIAHIKRHQAHLDDLPDTGTLRGDLLGLFKPKSMEQSVRQMQLTTAIAALLAQDPTLSESIEAAIVDPWVEANFRLMKRAQQRGEIAPKADIKALSRIIPSMAAYRGLVQRKAFDFAFLKKLVDTVVLPALTFQKEH
jgi:AcrR family transcriptional regulator